MTRTIVYIDGFNLYYRVLRPLGHKWMNIHALSMAVLPASNQITAVKYYTARISGRLDPGAPARQHAYLKALESLPLVSIHYGNFRTDKKWSGLVQPPDFRPACTLPTGAAPQVAYVWETEEKGSDWNLVVHLVRDAFTHAFDEAAVLTNDTDKLLDTLCKPLSLLKCQTNLALRKHLVKRLPNFIEQFLVNLIITVII